jgi:hypothetical protein
MSTILSSNLREDQQIWSRALEDLKLQLPKATFDTWLMGTTADLDGDTLTVLVGNTFAEEWLEYRLRDRIEAAVAACAGRPLTLVFAIKSANHDDAGNPGRVQSPAEAPPERRPEGPPEFVEATSRACRGGPVEGLVEGQPPGSGAPALPAPGPGEIAVELVEFDPTKRGFVMTANYAIRFWQPYLGQLPFSLWQTLRSFAFRADEDAWPSIQTLADICANGNRHAILGRARRNGRKPIVGALETLENERIVWVLHSGSGRMTRYHFRVLGSLPLLTPGQIQRLTPRLQEAHERFLQRCAIDYEEWKQLTLPSLMSGT